MNSKGISLVLLSEQNCFLEREARDLGPIIPPTYGKRILGGHFMSNHQAGGAYANGLL